MFQAILGTVFLASLLGFHGPRAAIGEKVPDFEFRTLRGHDGRTKLSELYGQPVILAGWKTHFSEGLHAAYPAYQLLLDHGEDGLLLIMEDRQVRRSPLAEEGVLTFWKQASQRLALIDREQPEICAWISYNPNSGGRDDVPIERTAPRDVRSLVLIGVDGTLIAQGSAEDISADERHDDFRVQFRKLVAREMERLDEGWGQDRMARKARAMAFGAGKLAAALRYLGDPSDDEPGERAEVRREIERRFEALLKSARYYLEGARPLDAERVLDDLAKSVRGHDPFEARVERMVAMLESHEMRRELHADRELMKVLRPLQGPLDRKRVSVKHAKRFRAWLDAFSGTQVGARAKELEPIVLDLFARTMGIRRSELDERMAD